MESTQQAARHSSLQAISDSYVDTVKQAEEEKDPLGRDAFLQMLIAQLENQDPLNPMEGTEFTTQLAQYSSLEQQFNTNDNLEAILDAVSHDNKSDENLMDYIGKEVYGENETIIVNDGGPSKGYFSINQPADVLVSVYDSSGSRVKDMYLGQKDPGMYEIGWNGKDSSGAEVPMGEYTFQVVAMNSDGGLVPSESALSGIVTGVTKMVNGSYLQVGDRQISPDNIIKVKLPDDG